jgi:hypothetical protein
VFVSPAEVVKFKLIVSRAGFGTTVRFGVLGREVSAVPTVAVLKIFQELLVEMPHMYHKALS